MQLFVIVHEIAASDIAVFDNVPDSQHMSRDYQRAVFTTALYVLYARSRLQNPTRLSSVQQE